MFVSYSRKALILATWALDFVVSWIYRLFFPENVGSVFTGFNVVVAMVAILSLVIYSTVKATHKKYKFRPVAEAPDPYIATFLENFGCGMSIEYVGRD